MKIALAQINPTIGALDENCQKIIHMIDKARRRGARIVVFPEMAVTGYPPEDLLLLPSFIQGVTHSIKKIIAASHGIAVFVGCVRENPDGGEKRLYNSAAFIENGELIGFQDKMLLPDYDVFSERRYFEPGSHIRAWDIEGKTVAVTICEDIWQHAGSVEYTSYMRDPVKELMPQRPDVLLNLSASPYYVRRYETRLHVCRSAAATLHCPVLFCNQVGGNDSLIFDGYSLCIDAEGHLFGHAKAFEEDLLVVDLDQKYPPITLTPEPVKELFQALVLGLRDYFYKLGWKKACLGLSGGIDSALVAVLAKEALGSENVLALTLPSRFSSPEGLADAKTLAATLGITCHELSIEKPFEAFLETLEPSFHDMPPDVTEENLQARIRGTLLMAFSNKFGYLLLSTGNKSEMAMGYTTLYGDMCGGLGVLGDVSKEQVYALARYINSTKEVIPHTTIDRPPSAELRPNQRDDDSLPPYPLVDRVLQDYVEEHLSPEQIAQRHHFSLDLVKELVRKIHLSEYKRRQAPPCLRVTKKAFSIGRRFPIVQHWNMKK
ncbi:NAD+ synthase [Chlamydiota bacterium]